MRLLRAGHVVARRLNCGVMRHSQAYPFRPKSTASLRVGQFWAVPFASGSFGCGRVLQLNGAQLPSKSRAFFGGLHNWRGSEPPTAEAIAGSRLLAFGVMHIRAIAQTGGDVLGERALESDGLELPLLLSSQGGEGTLVLRGAEPLREARKEEWGTLPVLGFWGYDFIQQLAQQHLHRGAA
jgi:hypothetical protein